MRRRWTPRRPRPSAEAIDASAQDLSQSGTVELRRHRHQRRGGHQPLPRTAHRCGAAAASTRVWRRRWWRGSRPASTDAAAPGSTPWSYAVNDANLDFLSAGETITFSYTVTATDSQGATATDTVSYHHHRQQRCADGGRLDGLGLQRGDRCQRQDLSQSGTVDFGDIDTNDVVDITCAANSDIVWSGGSIDAGLAAALVAGFSTGVDGRGGAWQHAVELRGQRRQPRLPVGRRDDHLLLHGDGDRQPGRDRHRHGEHHHHRQQRCADGGRLDGLGLQRGDRCQRAGPEPDRHGRASATSTPTTWWTSPLPRTAPWCGAAAASTRAWRRRWWRVLDRRRRTRRRLAAAVELHGQRRQPRLPVGRRDDHLLLHGDGDRQPGARPPPTR